MANILIIHFSNSIYCIYILLFKRRTWAVEMVQWVDTRAAKPDTEFNPGTCRSTPTSDPLISTHMYTHTHTHCKDFKRNGASEAK